MNRRPFLNNQRWFSLPFQSTLSPKIVTRLTVVPGRIATVFGDFREAGRNRNLTVIITILSHGNGSMGYYTGAANHGAKTRGGVLCDSIVLACLLIGLPRSAACADSICLARCVLAYPVFRSSASASDSMYGHGPLYCGVSYFKSSI